MIIWLNGGFGAGKTTLAQELRGRLSGAVVYNPEDVGAMLWKWLPRNDDFQDLPSWRELVVAAAVSLRRHHADTLIVRMSLIRDDYRDEILGGLTDAGEQVLHVFLEADGDELKRRLQARAVPADAPGSADAIREWAFSRVDAAVAAARRQPEGTLLLRSDQRSPAELADQVLAAVDRAQPHRTQRCNPRRHRQEPVEHVRDDPLDERIALDQAVDPLTRAGVAHASLAAPVLDHHAAAP